MKHSNASLPCQKCEAEAATLDPEVRKWWDYVHWRVPFLHISDGWRDEVTQNEYYRQKKSMRRWPDSKHNRMKGGKPAAIAWDCFRLSPGGKAEFPNPDTDSFYKTIAVLLEGVGAPIVWAGTWKGRFRESVHFELADD